MFIDTSEFASSSRTVEVAYPCPAIAGTIGSGEVVHLAGTLRRIRLGIRLSGRLKTRISLPCARCGEVYAMAVDTEFSLLYRPAKVAGCVPPGETEVSGEDCALTELDEQGRIDLLSLAREQVYLSLPLKSICRPDCRGLCSWCGTNLNAGPCTCPRDVGDSRWGTLADLGDRLSAKS